MAAATSVWCRRGHRALRPGAERAELRCHRSLCCPLECCLPADRPVNLTVPCTQRVGKALTLWAWHARPVGPASSSVPQAASLSPRLVPGVPGSRAALEEERHGSPGSCHCPQHPLAGPDSVTGTAWFSAELLVGKILREGFQR